MRVLLVELSYYYSDNSNYLVKSPLKNNKIFREMAFSLSLATVGVFISLFATTGSSGFTGRPVPIHLQKHDATKKRDIIFSCRLGKMPASSLAQIRF